MKANGTEPLSASLSSTTADSLTSWSPKIAYISIFVYSSFIVVVVIQHNKQSIMK